MSTITIINNTSELVRIAIYRKPVLNPTLASIAWKVVAPPPGGGRVTIPIPESMEVSAKYSGDYERPSNLDCETAHLPFAETTARFTIDSVASQDRRTSGAIINQSFNDLVMNEVRVQNNFSIGCLTSITLDEDPIYAPQVIWPGGVLMEDVRGSFYVAVVGQFTYKGQRLVQEETSLTEVEVLEGGAVQVSGSMWTGYALNVM